MRQGSGVRHRPAASALIATRPALARPAPRHMTANLIANSSATDIDSTVVPTAKTVVT